MTTQANHTTLPISPDVFWPITGLVTLVLICLLIVKSMPSDEEHGANSRGLDALMDQLGVSRGWVGPLLFGGLILLTILGVSLFELARSYFFSEEVNVERFGVFASIVTAFIAGLFLAWRNLVLGKQAAIQDQALFNDKINAASEDLAARRQVTRIVKDKDGLDVILTEWEDDLVKRSAGIDRFLGLAQERPSEIARIARQLSGYIRQVSKEKQAILQPENLTYSQFEQWLADEVSPHSDIEKAAQVLGKLQKIEGNEISAHDIDLKHANLQRCDLADLSFENVNMYGVKLQGANLVQTSFKGSQLTSARLRAAYLAGTDFCETDLKRADMQSTRFFGCFFNDKTKVTDAKLQEAGFVFSDKASYQKFIEFSDQIFAVGVGMFSTGSECPSHWRKELMGYKEFSQEWRQWRSELSED